MDFGMFGPHLNAEQMTAIRAFLASHGQQAQANQQQQQQQQQAGGDGQGRDNPGSGEGQQQETPVFMHNAAHNGVVCDICNEEIRGFRYKCAQCPDFDLCAKCEHKGHHAGHVMLRISFPEQARDAIRKYLSNAPSSCPPSPPTPHGHGPVPPTPFPFPGLGEVLGHGRRGHGCRARRAHGHGHGHGAETTQDEDVERPTTAPGKKGSFRFSKPPCMVWKGRVEKRCPYNMGKKEFKRWSKWMKRAATHQHRSAEAYARAAAAGGGAGAAAAAGSDSEPESPVDFAAVASQIQEFLNYWGIPVDVVELYDQFGNRGQPQGQQRAQTEGNATTTTAEQNQAGTAAASASTPAASANAGPAAQTASTATTVEATGTTTAQAPTAAAANLSENMQQMTIDDTQNQNNTGASAPREESMLVDLDAENSGWTILNDSREQSPTGSTTGQQQTGEATATAAAATAPPPSQPSTGSSMNSNNGNPSFVSAASSSTGQQTPTTTHAPTAPGYPTGLPNVPLYPVLNPPQIQQILQGVSSAVNSVVRSIPIVTDPRGPLGTNVTNSTGVPAAAAAPPSPSTEGELDARSMKTLNQLLAMGFSNEGGYLTRLVVAKKGDLEQVLSSLFPN